MDNADVAFGDPNAEYAQTKDADPTDSIDWHAFNLRTYIQSAIPYRMARTNPFDFEKVMAMAFTEANYSVEQTPKTGDYGADLLIDQGHTRRAVQLKRYTSGQAIGVRDINQLVGAAVRYGCDQKLLTTTSRFTAKAQEHAAKLDVELWDWPQLRRFLESIVSSAR